VQRAIAEAHGVSIARQVPAIIDEQSIARAPFCAARVCRIARSAKPK